jgi:hypothetical protein
MPTIKELCPSCDMRTGVPLVWGDLGLLSNDIQGKIESREMICGGDAITIDGYGRRMNTGCLSCGEEWLAIGVDSSTRDNGFNLRGLDWKT